MLLNNFSQAILRDLPLFFSVFKERIEKMNPIYIAFHIIKINTVYTNQPALIENSLWRIASNAELFWDGEAQNLNPDGTLSDKQREKVWEFIERFKSSQSGQETLKMLNKQLISSGKHC